MMQVLGQLINDAGDTLQQNEGQEGRQSALHVDGQDCFDNIECSVGIGSDEQHCIGHGGPHTPLHLPGQVENAMIFKLQQYFGQEGRQCVLQIELHEACVGAKVEWYVDVQH